MKRLPRRPNQSLRDFPTYTIPEAATYLTIPTDEPVWPVAGTTKGAPLPSFRDLAQAYYIEVVRQHFGLSLSKTHAVMEAARRESKSEYPLLKNNIWLFFKHVLMEKPARGRQPHRIIDLTDHRQLVIPEIFKPFSTRIHWDNIGKPLREAKPEKRWLA